MKTLWIPLKTLMILAPTNKLKDKAKPRALKTLPNNNNNQIWRRFLFESKSKLYVNSKLKGETLR